MTGSRVTEPISTERSAPGSEACKAVCTEFSRYLDGAVSGVEMAAISGHLDGCAFCAAEFTAWRDVQRSLYDLGPAHPPERLQAHLLAAIAAERERGTHLSVLPRLLLLWKSSLAPVALRVSGGLAMAIMLLAGMGWLFGTPIAVQANDDRMAHLIAPKYLYSQVPPRPIETRRDVPIVVEAKVDTQGRVYDYNILEGPADRCVQVRIADNLLSSVFEPATVFGVPVRGNVVLTYTGVSVKG